MSTIIATLCGAVAGLGCLLALTASPRHCVGRGLRERWSAWATRLGASRARLATAGAAGVLVLVVTRWPVAALLAAVAAVVLPGMLRGDPLAASTQRMRAVASWTEHLRDTLAAAAGLEQAILAACTQPPTPIAVPVSNLGARLRTGQRLPAALEEFAAEVDDPCGDLVVIALLHASTHHARSLVPLLDHLAQAVRQQVEVRARAHASRARIRTATRVVTITTLSMGAGLAVLNRGYLLPYDAATGQLVLLVVGGLFAAGFAWLRRIAAPTPQPRLLTEREVPR